VGGDLSLSLEMAAGAVYYGALIAAVGSCAVRWSLVPALPRPSARQHLERTSAALGLSAVALASAALLLRAWTHTAAAFGAREAFAWSNLHAIAIESRWGGRWQAQVAATALALLSAIAVRRRLPGAWVAFAAAALAMCGTLPLIGHAAGSVARIVLHAGHVLGAGLWIGSLSVLYADARRAGHLAAFRLFSTTALAGVAIVVLTGLIAASLYVGTLGNLAGSTYGRILAVKLVLVAGAAACGFRNWRRLHRGADEATVDGTRRTVRLELLFALAVVAATGILTELPHP
jgi:putative copper export protein